MGRGLADDMEGRRETGSFSGAMLANYSGYLYLQSLTVICSVFFLPPVFSLIGSFYSFLLVLLTYSSLKEIYFLEPSIEKGSRVCFRWAGIFLLPKCLYVSLLGLYVSPSNEKKKKKGYETVRIVNSLFSSTTSMTNCCPQTWLLCVILCLDPPP